MRRGALCDAGVLSKALTSRLHASYPGVLRTHGSMSSRPGGGRLTAAPMESNVPAAPQGSGMGASACGGGNDSAISLSSIDQHAVRSSASCVLGVGDISTTWGFLEQQ